MGFFLSVLNRTGGPVRRVMRPAGLTVPGTVLCRASCLLLLLCLICTTITSSPLERKHSTIDAELANAKGRRHRQPKMRRPGKGGSGPGEGHPTPEPGQAEIVRLLDAFGLKTVPTPNRTAVTPPPFMLNLYHQLESTVGSSHHTGNATRANTVRSFNEKDSKSSRHKYIFDTSSVLNRETVLAAELQLYKQKPRPVDGWTDDMLPSKFTCELYELRERVTNPLLGGPSRTLIDRKMVNFTQRGWVHFNVTSTFAGSNHPVSGEKHFELRIKTEVELPKGTVVFSKRPRPKHADRRPLLVLFLDDKNVLASDITLPGAEPLSSQASGRDIQSRNRENWEVAEDAIPGKGTGRSDRRKRRASSRTGNRSRDKCKLYDYYVDFNVIGWSNWVIAPNGYTANYCEGDCPFPLDLNFNATNHATVQAILHMHTGTFRNNRRLPNPCCVPSTLEGIHVLYLDDSNNVVLKEFSDMIATSCGCE